MPTDWFAHCYADWVFQWGKEEADRLADEWKRWLSRRPA